MRPVALRSARRQKDPSMHHDATLIATLAVGFVLAFALGFVAHRLRLPPLVGYLVAGILFGPSSPGFAGNVDLAGQFAEVGVILLMFGVGLHFSVDDLLAVRGIAIPGAIGQIVLATALGVGIATAWGWSLGAGLVLGLALSVASTVVLLRALDQQNALETPNGRIAIGWLIVEDLAMVLALVLLPLAAGFLGGDASHVLAPGADASPVVAVLVTLGKVAAFVALIMVVGRRAIPWLLEHVARTGSRELFTLAVLAIALGIAYGSAELFGVSFALGAFFAGLVLSGSELSHRAAAESLPLQDAFAVLFFVSVGMLFDPTILLRDPQAVLAVLLVILIGKAIVAFIIVLALGYPISTALMVSASLAQVGEFSFILAGLGMTLGLLPAAGRDFILAGALLSITLNPVAFAAVTPLTRWFARRGGAIARLDARGHVRLAAVARTMEEAQEAAAAASALRQSLQIKRLMDAFPMFARLDQGDREELLALFKPRFAAPGERLIRIGDQADRAFFISSGAVEVAVEDERIRLGPGELFGEIALLSGGRRTADVTAIDYCELLVMEDRDFRRFVEQCPQLRAEIDEVAARRHERNLERSRRRLGDSA
jgi:monovalent cation:H+ antiporter-2, CPA2 family